MDTHSQPTTNVSKVNADRLLPGPGVLLSRGLVYLVLALIAAAVVWAWCTQVDEIVEAQGRITVLGEPIAITAAESGLVSEVAVRVGDQVIAGAVLMRLDPFDKNAEAQAIDAEINTIIAESRRYLAAEKAAANILAALDAEYQAMQSEYRILSEQLARLQKLREHPHVQNLATLDDVQDKAQQLEQARARLCGIEVERSRTRREALEQRQFVEQATARIAERRTRIAQLEKRIERLNILAPVSGIVIELAVQHAGSVLDTSRPAVVIVPGDQALAAKVCIANSSMKRMREGLDTRVSLDAFPFEDYGYLKGRLTSIEPDTNESGEYVAWIVVDRPELAGSQLLRELKPGLNLQAKIVVGRASVLEFLLKPLRRLAAPMSISS
jgi:multidrug resistance efflux pump